MKKRNVTLWGLVLGCLFGANLFAQTTVNYPTAGSATFSIVPPNTCSYNFFDNGGSAANYSSAINQNALANSVTFAPSAAANKIQATFSVFATENTFDALYVWDGNTTTAPQISSGLGALNTPFAGGWQATTAPNNFGAGIVRATAGNASGALTFSFSSDGSVTCAGWAAAIVEIASSACAITAPANVTTSTSAGVCQANSVNVNTPTFAPAGCNAAFSLQYRINGGAAVVIGSVVPATIAVTNVPKGVNTISWELVNSCGGGIVSSATSTITVNDTTPPVITCPASLTINLAPGDCAAPYSYNVTSSDNCPFAGPSKTLNTITAGGNGNAANGMVWFDIVNNSALPVVITGFKCSINGATLINVYSKAGTHVGFQTNAAAWTLAGQANATVGPFGVGVLTNAPMTTGSITVAPGATTGIALGMVSTGSNYTNGNGANQTYTDGTITLNAGSSANAAFGAPFTPRVFNGSVIYNTFLPAPPVTQTAGLPSGAEFPIGTTVNTFSTTDASGNVATCSFSITVNEYPNAIHSLVCNDLVQISLDENCGSDVNADQVLEGGPYGCYDNYIVEVDRTVNGPAANGPWSPAVFGPSDIGKTYYYRVTDPSTGNTCWGQIKIEDKLPPVLVCRNIVVECNETPEPVPAPAITGPQSIIYTGLSDIIENNTSPLNYNFDFSYIPSGTPVLDVNVRLKLTGHTWLPDLNVIAINPAGTQISVFTVGGCVGQEWPIDCVFDDSGLGGITLCAQLNAGGAPLQCLTAGVSVPGKLAPFNGTNASGNWTVRITDSFAGDDGVVEEVGLIVTVDAPAIPVVDGCAGTLTLGNGLSYVDHHTAGSCAGAYGTTIRTWTAVDASGNKSTCDQVITFKNPDLNDVVLPVDYDGVDAPALECGGVYPTPEYLNAIGLEGTPTVFGSTFGCTINWEYDDLVLPVCDGTYKIKRTWTIVDWCAGTGFDYVQLIKIHDGQGPDIACPANMTVSTDPYTCCATVDLPDVVISDNCSRINNISGYVVGFDPFTGAQIGTFPFGGYLSSFPGNNLWAPDTLANFGQTVCLPVGQHTVYYEAEDDCGNVSTCSFRLTVRDYTPPVAACDEYTVVGIGLDDPFDCYAPNAHPGDCSAGGVTWVKATTFDDGSYDNCGDVKFTVRRMGPDYSDCILALNPTNGFDVNGAAPDGAAANCFDIFADFPSEFERAISEYDSIKFYCCEVGTTQTVVLRVYQLDVDGNISIGPDGTPIYNECMVQVEVQDKIKPACQAPANVVVSCEAFDPSLWAYGNAVPSDNCCLDTTKVYQGQCGLSHTVVLTNFDSLCNKGTITRRWTAYDCHGLTSQCTQRIIVNYNQNYYVKFPADKLVSTCDGTGQYGAPEFYGEDCELLATSFVDEIFTVVPDACYKIERTWTVINWCTYNPNQPCTNVPNPNPSNTTNAPANLPGVTVSAPGTTINGWNPTVVKINPSDPQPTNYSTFWAANTNCYKYKQIIKVYDTQDPSVVTPTPAEYCDYSTNDANFWNASYWWDATIGSHDLCEGDADIAITATDACSGANISFRYLLFLDLDGNGSMETVVNSVNPPGFNNIQFNNANNQNYGGGESRAFDFRPVNANQKWGFGLLTDAASGNNRTAHVRWFNQQGQNAVPQLPYGTHKIKWFIEDGCGNEYISEQTLVVKDCKKPTVVCLNGLSVNLMNIQGGMVQLWASDFLQYTQDNCTPADQLKIGIRRSGTGTGFPTNPDGTAQTGVSFTCADLGTQLVELWSIDKAGNADFCETYVLIQDNMGVCGNTNATVSGALKTNTAQEGVENATVELNGTNPAGLPVFNTIFTPAAGNYLFSNALPVSSSATVTPTLELDPLNGVNTYDLILISRHILGLEPLNTPYKLIAADANKSGTVTTFDVVELRKLILGTYTELPGNSSWRFVDKSQNFNNPANPFAEVIRENLSIASIQSSVNNGDFVGVKVGDVDETAVPNQLVASDDRTTGTLLFDVEDRAVKAGEQFSVNFKAADKAQGYQFTMNLNNLEVMNIVPGANMTADNFAVFADAITTSADGSNGEFTVNFRAKADGQLSQMVGVSSRITKAVAFDATASKLDVAFRFNKGGVSTIAGVGFELYQNSPNPFVNKTFVGFHLPEATSATLTVYDETGRVLYTTQGDFAKGYNAISLDRANLRANGLLYYKLETATDSATKKMIQSK